MKLHNNHSFSYYLLPVIPFLLYGCRAAPPAPVPADPAQLAMPVRTALPVIGPIESYETASGVVTPLPDREASVNAGVPGKVRAVLVRPGDRVVKGQTLVVLDTARLEAQLQQAQAALASAQAQQGQAALEVLSQKRMYQTGVQQAESNLRSAQVALDKLHNLARPQEIAQAHASVLQAQATVENDRTTADRDKYLFNRGIAPKKDWQAAETQYQIAQQQLASAQESESLVKAGARPQDIQSAKIQVEEAQVALKQARAGRTDTEAKKEALSSFRSQTKQALAAVQAARADLRLATVHAPISGTVVQRAVGPGSAVDTSTVLMTLADLTQVQFVAQLQPADLARTHPGQTASLSVAAYPHHTWTGRVLQVSPATDPTTNTVPARILFPNSDRLLKDDMYGTVRIGLVWRSGAILVPKSAVLVGDTGSAVFVVGARHIAHRRAVKTGITQGSQVEVTSGLTGHERVVVTGNYGLEDGARVKEAA